MKKGRIFQEQGTIDPDTNMPGVSKAKQSPMWPEGKTERQQGVGRGGWEGPTLQGHARAPGEKAAGGQRRGCRGRKEATAKLQGQRMDSGGAQR